jgi:hypothetical protein
MYVKIQHKFLINLKYCYNYFTKLFRVVKQVCSFFRMLYKHPTSVVPFIEFLALVLQTMTDF